MSVTGVIAAILCWTVCIVWSIFDTCLHDVSEVNSTAVFRYLIVLLIFLLFLC